MASDPRDRVLQALSGDAPDRTPVAIFTQSATYGQMDACGASWPEAHSDPAKMARLGSAQAEAFGFESARVPFCVTGEAEALGCEVDLNGREGMPAIRRSLQTVDPMTEGLSEVPDIDPSEYVSSGRLAVTIEAVSIIKREHEELPAIAGAVAPLTLTGQALGAEAVAIGSIMCPDEVGKWSAAMDRLQTEYVKALADAGADVVLMPDGVASPDLIDPSQYMALAGSRSSCLRTGRVKSVLHICGAAMPIADDMASTGADALSLEDSVDPFELMEKVRGRCQVVGSVGPVRSLLGGTTRDVVAEARRCEDAGFAVVAPGCGICPGTSDENMRALSGSLRRRLRIFHTCNLEPCGIFHTCSFRSCLIFHTCIYISAQTSLSDVQTQDIRSAQGVEGGR